MYAIKKASLLLLIVGVSLAQETIWSPAPPVNVTIPTKILLDYDDLRNFEPTGRLIETNEMGSLKIEVREIITSLNNVGEINITEPASIMIRYRNRLVAAASGYRLGGELTNNGIIIEVWDGINKCQFSKVVLNFAGERLKVTENNTIQVPKCTS